MGNILLEVREKAVAYDKDYPPLLSPEIHKATSKKPSPQEHFNVPRKKTAEVPMSGISQLKFMHGALTALDIRIQVVLQDRLLNVYREVNAHS